MRNSKSHMKQGNKARHREEKHRGKEPTRHPKRMERRTATPLPRSTETKTITPEGFYWLYGHHAVKAALDNDNRKFRRLIHSGHKDKNFLSSRADLPHWEEILPEQFSSLLPKGAVHQGIAALVEPLAEPDIEEICHLLQEKEKGLLLILDQVTDPHNVGAILRSAAAFGADAVILTERHAAPQSGVLGKAASGALEIVPLCRVVNLARALERIQQAGFWSVGLAGDAEKELTDIDLKGKIALILGSEESGLRRLTRENADFLCRLPTKGPVDQLNVSNAAAIALYEVIRRR